MFELADIALGVQAQRQALGKSGFAPRPAPARCPPTMRSPPEKIIVATLPSTISSASSRSNDWLRRLPNRTHRAWRCRRPAAQKAILPRLPTFGAHQGHHPARGLRVFLGDRLARCFDKAAHHRGGMGRERMAGQIKTNRQFFFRQALRFAQAGTSIILSFPLAAPRCRQSRQTARPD